jgi:hypothetical protein
MKHCLVWFNCQQKELHNAGTACNASVGCWELMDASRVPMRVWLSISFCAAGGGGLALDFSSNGPMEMPSVTLKSVAATNNSVIGGQPIWWWCVCVCVRVCALSAIWIGAGMLPMAALDRG